MEEAVSVEFVKHLALVRKLSHKEISDELQRRNPGMRGLSEMSVRCFCNMHNIHRTMRMSEEELDEAVFTAVSQVGLHFMFLSRVHLQTQSLQCQKCQKMSKNDERKT